jgi:protease-4
MAFGSDTTSTAVFAVAIIGALVVSAVLAPVAFQATQPEPDRIMVVTIDGGIQGSTVNQAVDHLREARTNESIKGVVLQIDSSGGSAAMSEKLFMAVERTDEQLPVAVSLQAIAASGGYYAAAPADRIFTLPATEVGSIGVIAQTSGPIPDSYIRSGPDKASGRMEKTHREVEALQASFVSSVLQHRGPDSDHQGTKLTLSRSEIEHAKTYIGLRAVENGLADEIGGTPEAVAWVANEAGLDSYQVVRKNASPFGFFFFSTGEDGNRTLTAQEYMENDGYKYYMLTPEFETQQEETDGSK